MLQTLIKNSAQKLICGEEIKSPFDMPFLRIKSMKDLGLSIGQSVSVTMAMERSFGEKGLSISINLKLIT